MTRSHEGAVPPKFELGGGGGGWWEEEVEMRNESTLCGLTIDHEIT